MQKPLKFSRPHLSNVDLISCAAKPFWKLLPEPRSWTVPPPSSSSNFRVTRPYAKVLETLRAEHYARWENRTWLVFLRVRYNFLKTICWGMLSFLKKKCIFLASLSAIEWLLDFLWLLISTPLVTCLCFVPIPRRLYYYRSVVSLKIRCGDSSPISFWFRIALVVFTKSKFHQVITLSKSQVVNSENQ